MEEIAQSTNTRPSEGAGFGIRAAARVIDAIYGFALGLIGGFAGGILLVVLEQAGLATPGWQDRVGGLNLVGWGLGLVGGLSYHSVTEGMFGATLGKLICGLRVVSESGEAITVVQAFKRSVAYFWDALFFGLVGYASMRESELNQRYGDHWAKTVVVKSQDMAEGARSGFEIFVLAFLMGSVGWVVCLGAGLVIDAL